MLSLARFSKAVSFCILIADSLLNYVCLLQVLPDVAAVAVKEATVVTTSGETLQVESVEVLPRVRPTAFISVHFDNSDVCFFFMSFL